MHSLFTKVQTIIVFEFDKIFTIEYDNTVLFTVKKIFEKVNNAKVIAIRGWETHFRAFQNFCVLCLDQQATFEENFTMSLKTVYNVLNFTWEKRSASYEGKIYKAKPKVKSVRKKEWLQKLNRLTKKENPVSQTHMCQLMSCHHSTLKGGIKDLGKKQVVKRKVHRLEPHHFKNRKVNTRKLYESKLAGDKWFCCNLGWNICVSQSM